MTTALREALHDALRVLWPRRAHQELLLDLGEHKRWGDEHRAAAIDDVACWLQKALDLPARLTPTSLPTADANLAALRHLGERL